jgi:hypothetical protein
VIVVAVVAVTSTQATMPTVTYIYIYIHEAFINNRMTMVIIGIVPMRYFVVRIVS